MKISTLLEERKLLAVIYGGRFQPFHRGHYAVYRSLCKTFGEGAVWIATSNKTNFDPANGDVSPFNFEEKLEIMVQLFGISPEKVIKCKNPVFAPKEVLELYKAPTVCVMVAGDKDVDRYKGSKLFKPYPLAHGKPVPFAEAMPKLQTVKSEPPQMYYFVNDARDGSQSGTSIRKAFQQAGDDNEKQRRVFKELYKKDDDEILDLMVSKIQMIKEPPKQEKDDKPVKVGKQSKIKDLPESKLNSELSLIEAPSQLPSRKELLELQAQLIDMLPDRFDVGLDEHGVTVQEPKTSSRSGKKLWVIPNTFDESLYYGELDMKGITYKAPRRNALLKLVQFMTWAGPSSAKHWR